MPYDTSCMYSVVKNTSGADMYFSFLPLPHGSYIASGDEVVIRGNVLDQVAACPPPIGQRRFDKLVSMVEDHTVTIQRLPNPILLDAASGDPEMLYVNTTLQLENPSWEFSASADVY